MNKHSNKKSNKRSNKKSNKNLKKGGNPSKAGVDFSTLKYEIINTPYRDELLLNLKKDQEIYCYNAKYTYFNKSIKKGKKMGSVGGIIKRRFFGEEARMVTYKATDNGMLKIFHSTRDDDKALKNYKKYTMGYKANFIPNVSHTNLKTIKLDKKNPVALVHCLASIMATTSNIKLESSFTLKGAFTDVDTFIPRLHLEEGHDVGYIWVETYGFEEVKIKEGESLIFKPTMFVYCKLNDKKNYSIIIKKLKSFIQLDGPSFAYIVYPQIPENYITYKGVKF
jgi:hypothetical protein